MKYNLRDTVSVKFNNRFFSYFDRFYKSKNIYKNKIYKKNCNTKVISRYLK